VGAEQAEAQADAEDVEEAADGEVKALPGQAEDT
jgi:hypothetical protein